MGLPKKNKVELQTKEVELFRFYKITKYDLQTGEDQVVNKMPKDWDYTLYDYDYGSLDNTGVTGSGDIYDVAKFVEVYNSIPNKEQYERIGLWATGEGYDNAYPTLIGIRIEGSK